MLKMLLLTDPVGNYVLVNASEISWASLQPPVDFIVGRKNETAWATRLRFRDGSSLDVRENSNAIFQRIMVGKI